MTFRIAAAQAAPLALGDDREAFAAHVRTTLTADTAIDLLVYPELHLFHSPAHSDDERNAALRASAIDLDGELVDWLRALARETATWLIPGSLVERGPGTDIYNTAIVINPRGDIVATYRKIFPWRPYEPYTPGGEFVVWDIDGVGRFGISICYDAWFPEVSRSLAWMGADIVINIVKTTTPDRAQETVLARANSIVNQTFTVSVNTAGPLGFGDSLIVGPEGEVLSAAAHTNAATLILDFDAAHVRHVRAVGTAGTNRMWDQFQPTDAPLALPIYGGRIDPSTWAPAHTTSN